MHLNLAARLNRKLAHHVPGDRRTLALPRGALSVTFDDFPRSAWTEAGPVLERHGARATYFVAGAFCGVVDDGVPQYDEADLQAVHAAGHEIGCHTFEHRSALHLTPETFEASLDRNADWITERLGPLRLESFAYPFGHVSMAARRCVARRFASARGVDAGLNAGVVSADLLAAVGLEQRQMRTHGLEELIARTARQRGWLILFTHDVSDRPTPFGCRPEDLDEVLTLARDAGLDVAPVREIARRLGPRKAASGERQAGIGLQAARPVD